MIGVAVTIGHVSISGGPKEGANSGTVELSPKDEYSFDNLGFKQERFDPPL